MKFDDLELSDPILRSLQNQKYKEPTPIQSKVIPEIANGKDVMAAAQTGTGKTAAFVLPILNKLTHFDFREKSFKSMTAAQTLLARIDCTIFKFEDHLLLSCNRSFSDYLEDRLIDAVNF